MWNDLNLECPIEDVCIYNSNDTVVSNLAELISSLTSAADILTKDHPIWTEIKVFQNVQAKYRRILHCDKCLLLLQRVGSCLRKVVLLNLSKIYLDIAEQFLKGIQNQSSSTQLPSRQQLEYVLLRTQSAAKLLCEALHYSRETFCYLVQKLKIGHLVLNLMMATSVTARVNILFKGILIQLFDIYRTLYSWHQKLKSGTYEWPKPLELPEDLEAWLNPEVSELLRPKSMSEDQLSMLLNFYEREKNEKVLNEEEKSDIDQSDCIIINEINKLLISSNPDIGDVVPREEITNKKQLTQSASSSNVEPIIGEITNKKQLIQSASSSNVEPIIGKIPNRKQLTQLQNILLEKVKSARNVKALRAIWNNTNVSSRDLLPELVPSKIRLIHKLFIQSEKKIKKLKASPLTIEAKTQQVMEVTKLTAKKLVKHLGLYVKKSNNSGSTSSGSYKPIKDLKPVKSCKKLRALYYSLDQMFRSSQQYEKCSELKKFFRSRIADIKLLLRNGEKTCAKKLIFCTSKVFLTRFLQ